MLYYINGANRRLYSIDLSAANAVTMINRVGQNSKCLQMAPDGKMIYVLDEGSDNFIVVDLNDNSTRMEDIKGSATGCGCFVRYPR